MKMASRSRHFRDTQVIQGPFMMEPRISGKARSICQPSGTPWRGLTLLADCQPSIFAEFSRGRASAYSPHLKRHRSS